MSRRTINQLDRPPLNVVLSARELEILQLAALAMSNAQIGRQLVITEGTVKRHSTNIYAKLGGRPSKPERGNGLVSGVAIG